MVNETPIYPASLESEDMSSASGIKAYTKRVIDAGESPTDLPQNPWFYFNQTPTTVLMPTDSLITAKTTSFEDIEKSKKRFKAAYHNIIPKRNPITVSAIDNGMFEVIDGSSTLNIFRAMGWSDIAVEIQPQDA